MIRITNVHFQRARIMAVGVGQLFSRFEFVGNQVTDVVGVSRAGGFRVGAAVHPIAAGLPLGEISGEVLIADNRVDNPGSRHERPYFGEDDGIAVAGCRLSMLEILDNSIVTRGEGIEHEGCTNPDARTPIQGNRVVTDAALSFFAENVATPGEFPWRKGGHPAAVESIGNGDAIVEVVGNEITVNAGIGGRSAVCMLLGSTNPVAETTVRDNTCWMDGIYAGLLGGSAGLPGLFPPASLSSAEIRNNSFVGRAFLGIAFMDFDFPLPAFSLTNDGHDNVMRANDFSLFRPEMASLYFGPSTHDNVFVGDANGRVIDRGTDNIVRSQ